MPTPYTTATNGNWPAKGLPPVFIDQETRQEDFTAYLEDQAPVDLDNEILESKGDTLETVLTDIKTRSTNDFSWLLKDESQMTGESYTKWSDLAYDNVVNVSLGGNKYVEDAVSMQAQIFRPKILEQYGLIYSNCLIYFHPGGGVTGTPDQM